MARKAALVSRKNSPQIFWFDRFLKNRIFAHRKMERKFPITVQHTTKTNASGKSPRRHIANAIRRTEEDGTWLGKSKGYL